MVPEMNPVRRHAPLLILCFFFAGISGCHSPDPDTGTGNSAAGDALQIVATTGMVADLVRNVGGDRVQVRQIMGAGVDPHLYKPTRDDVRSLLSADMVFCSGLLLEGKMAETLKSGNDRQRLIAVAELLPRERVLAPDGENDHPDPHVWMDVAAWSECVDIVRDALIRRDAAHAEGYRERARLYREQLESLHRYGIASIATIPGESRVLITSHDAFRYFGKAYMLEVMGIQGLSTESEAGLKRINELVSLLVDRRIGAVFVESSVSPKSIKALIEGAKSRNHNVVIGGELYSDAMGESGTYEGTYIGMLDHNITVVTRALGGNAPELGLNGKLSTGK
jgi:manganese/zinc/iron transport system substrate-binding protein